MGSCLAKAALALGHEVIVVTGPVQVEYPAAASIISVVTTEEMLESAQQEFVNCDGIIGAAAPCDFRPVEVSIHKLKKNGGVLNLTLIETPDVLTSLAKTKRANQWTVGFALETEDARTRALAKLRRKNCDLIVLNDASAINSKDNAIEIIAPSGEIVSRYAGPKPEVAKQILKEIQARLIRE
jgi:phosphopantothenoylcysteine decarboxylase/phosphopantothenate--cysteine ligase